MMPPSILNTRPCPVHMAPEPVSVRERPVLFSGSMVRALLNGTKTQTRRIVKTHASVFGEAFLGPCDSQGFSRAHLLCRAYDREAMLAHCPYGHPGDRLWVREAYRFTETFDADNPSRVAERCLDAGYSKPWAPLKFEADGDQRNWMNVGTPTYPTTSPRAGKLRPGIHMPRWASRIDLEITDVRAERLNDVSESDAVDEGFYQAVRESPSGIGEDVIGWYRELWELINGAGSWASNPWVWVVDFRSIRP